MHVDSSNSKRKKNYVTIFVVDSTLSAEADSLDDLCVIGRGDIDVGSCSDTEGQGDQCNSSA